MYMERKFLLQKRIYILLTKISKNKIKKCIDKEEKFLNVNFFFQVVKAEMIIISKVFQLGICQFKTEKIL